MDMIAVLYIVMIQQYQNYTNIYVKQMNGSRTTRTNSSKPVNINISFTINPKNILNQQSFGGDNQLKNKKISGAILSSEKSANLQKPKTPQLSNTERVDVNKDFLQRVQDKKEKKSRKRNSVDQTYLNEYNRRLQGQKSVNMHKESQSLHLRKSSTKSKRPQQTAFKKKHKKTVSKMSMGQGVTMKQSTSGHIGSLDQKHKNFKSIINRLITNQLSKRSLPLSLPMNQTQIQARTSRKKKFPKKFKEGQSEYLLRKQDRQKQQQQLLSHQNPLNKKMLIQKLTSFRSINNSLFKSEEDEENRPKDRKTIVINTDHSIQCIDQIHQMERAAKEKERERGSRQAGGNGEGEKINQTKNLIQQYIAMMNQEIQYEGKVINEDNIPIQEEFQQFRKNYHNPYHQQVYRRDQNEQNQTDQQSQQQQQQHQQQVIINTKKQPAQTAPNAPKSQLVQFHSSQLTKQQKMINQIQRVKLTQLKKHQVEKWGELLAFIKQSLKEGKSNHDQILHNIYSFLEQTKSDLQNQVFRQPDRDEANGDKDLYQDFTNKFSSNQLVRSRKQAQIKLENQHEKSYNQISSMSYKDQDYEEQNQELKLMNLEMIQNALKSRHESLLDKKEKQLSSLEEQRNLGKISQSQFSAQRQRLEKWTKKQTGEIMQARKNIWKGYNEAKGIIQKSLKSKHFQQESAKKKSMMKCLSQNYLLKSYNYKKLLKQQQEQSQQLNSSQQQVQEQRPQKQQIVQKPQTKPSPIEVPQSQPKFPPFGQQSASDSQQINKQVLKQPISPSQQNQHQLSHSHEHSQSDSRSHSSQNQNENQNENENEIPSPPRTLNHTKQLSELLELGKEDDINIIKEKLLDIKNKHLLEDQPNQFNYHQHENQQDNYSQHQHEHPSPEISYEQVDNQLQQSISDGQIKLINTELAKQNQKNKKLQQSQKSPKAQSQSQADFQRLKHILPQDKQDIFQFIFLDLSIQLYQQPCLDNRLMDSINAYISYTKKQALKKKGIKTNLNIIKQYLKRFLAFILRAHRGVLGTLDEPVGPTAIEMLKYMHENDEDVEGGDQVPSALVITTGVFDLWEKSFLQSVEFQVYYENDEERQAKRLEFLKNIMHIHNKAIFDAMNQYLDLLRPFGIWGKPFPWKNSSSFYHLTTQQQKQQKLKKASEKVIEYCSYVCGLLVDKEQSLVGNARLSQDYIEQIKQDRLSRMLATELMQNQERWLFYDDEETQVLVEIANAIYVALVRQATLEIGASGGLVKKQCR